MLVRWSVSGVLTVCICCKDDAKSALPDADAVMVASSYVCRDCARLVPERASLMLAVDTHITSLKKATAYAMHASSVC